jgi:hypothetical protein
LTAVNGAIRTFLLANLPLANLLLRSENHSQVVFAGRFVPVTSSRLVIRSLERALPLLVLILAFYGIMPLSKWLEL